ncbi:thiamine-triphosphatase [Clupea harengus]|uniref:Thiamine-triphosphatase n=1 Tax=Clupea harengus TaxID=7950 RepID=A0A8M1KEU6_CLUHA|nr:thiamine-triphosphatase [Clupea harengus]XP_042561040.1 thiamine-triphosphatase [Clupea harengus]
MNVEVERKFVCDPDIQKKLKDIGAVCIGQRRFQDQYFDSPDFDLTLKDFWLRCREGCWELKCPVPKKTAAIQKDSQAEGLCSRYREITSLPEIKAELTRVMADEKRERDRGVAECDTLDDWLKEMSLGCFAKYTTERCSFSLEEEGEEGAVGVDLDQADFGYCVGEIEILVPDGGDIQAALRRIEKTADKLGLCGDKRVQGKMDVYLQRHSPDHYTKLLAAHIL